MLAELEPEAKSVLEETTQVLNIYSNYFLNKISHLINVLNEPNNGDSNA
jgi:hypothetical protein